MRSTISYNLLERGILMVHNRKCAGNSMKSALRFKGVRNTHDPAWKLRELVTADEWDRAFKFSFIRNPWERWVSLYLFRFIDRSSPTRSMVPDFHLYDTPEKFQLYTKKEVEHRLDLLGQRHTIPQSYWSRFTLDGETNALDFVGKYENLHEDWMKMCNILGLAKKLRHGLRNVNPTPRKDRRHYTEYYDKETREAIAQIYSIDIEKFGYKFGS